MNFKSQKGFTLIELLVVIAIIGVLASIVLASLNTARTKGQIASIKSNLKNIIPQAELAYDVPGNYSTVCTDTKVAGMLTAITNAGGTAACYSYNNLAFLDVNTRWGAAARLNSDPTQNFAVDPMGVVTFDTSYGPDTKMDWTTANTFCSSKGGRLPSVEELTTLWQVYGSNPIPPSTGFVADYYWSNTTLPSSSGNSYYAVLMTSNYIGSSIKVGNYYVRCVH